MAGVPFNHVITHMEDYAMAVWADRLYIFGGVRPPFGGEECGEGPRELDHLIAYDFLSNSCEVLHHQEGLSLSCPEGRHSHQMWALEGKLYIFGGRTRGDDSR